MKKSFDRVADIYDETRKMQPEAVSRIMRNISGEIGSPGGLVLDMGVGTGRIAVPLTEQDYRLVGIDISEKMLERLRDKKAFARRELFALRGDATSLPFADDSFRAVVSVHVFHLLEDIDACIREAKRVLAPDGRLLFGGNQQALRYMQQALSDQCGIKEDYIELHEEAGIKLLDRSDIERKVSESIGHMGGNVTRLPSVEWDYQISCEQLIGSIEKRQFSCLWNATDDSINALVKKLRKVLRIHLGTSSTFIKIRSRFDMYSAAFGV